MPSFEVYNIHLSRGRNSIPRSVFTQKMLPDHSCRPYNFERVEERRELPA